MLVNSPTSFFH